MENQNNTAAVVTDAATAAENGSSATQEVSSTTQVPAEPTKRSLRVQTWKKIQDNKCGVGFNAIFNRIPGFVDSDKAAKLLSETDEFKKAENIKVNIDRALHSVKLQTLLAGKTLYLPGTRDSKAIYLKVDVPADATDEQKKEILNVQDIQQHRTEITLDNKVKLDMVVIGSVLVSRDGYRIGRGNGFADQDIGLLTEIGSITPDTVIATMVHDLQVVDNLPKELFQKYDTPIDLIVTPTEVIHVAKRLPRPTGIFWELLSERRLKIVPVLQVLKENEEKAGKVIVLKEEDTDIEQNQNARSRRRGPIRRFRRRNQRRAISQTDTEQQGQEQQKRNPRRNRRFGNRRRRPTKSEGDQSGVEGKSQERKGAGGDRKQQQQQQRVRKNRLARDFCIKLSNITRDVRVKDLKSELRKRECNPLYISWKGQFGKCYLHFGNRNGAPSTEDEINKVLNSLTDFSLTVTTGGGGGGTGNASGGEGDAVQPPQTKTVPVNVELLKFDEKKADGGSGAAANGDVAAGGDAGAARIESVDTTTV
ncbi:PREDICTED: methenyltetrahydrofolate synthase domain-containing protein [Rhagoletis zephyria]|uniref:methenyltetrahydrofolate synthase domain-containing protein n=1 Tax=Rhagoletis zephyria TaxID=28612 RepID=UPI00081145B8|nr:PREDICTED: methenyltetrahydrofolate synthase domain-containing protein [Rhagoletis zephyria]